MPHSWKEYERARVLFRQLLEVGLVKYKDEKMIRGIIQIYLEDNQSRCSTRVKPDTWNEQVKIK